MNRLLWMSYGIFISIALSNHEGGYANPQTQIAQTQIEIQSDRHSTKFFSPPAHLQPLPQFKLQPAQNLTGWSIENSFSKKAISSDQKENSSTSDRPTEPDFDRSPFDDLYSLKIEFSQKSITGELEQNNTISLKLFKNPLALSGLGIPTLDKIYGLPPTLTPPIPSPFATTDFSSQKNSLQFTINHQASFAEQFSFSFFSEIYPKILDLSVVLKLPTLDPQDGDTFNLEMEASYQINDAISVYSFVNRESTDVLDLELGLSYQVNDTVSVYGSITRSLFPSSATGEIDDTGRLGLSFNLFDGNLETSLSLYKTIAKNVVDKDKDDAIASVGQYTRQGFELSAYGNPAPGLGLELIYTYADTTQPEAAKHTVELEIVYEIVEGALKGMGVASSVYLENGLTPKRGGIANPDNIEASAGVFYVGNGYRAALRFENLFAPQDLALIGTVIFKF